MGEIHSLLMRSRLCAEGIIGRQPFENAASDVNISNEGFDRNVLNLSVIKTNCMPSIAVLEAEFGSCVSPVKN